MKNLKSIFEGLLDNSVGDADAAVVRTLGEVGGILDRNFHLFMNANRPTTFETSLKDGFLVVRPSRAVVWDFTRPGGYVAAPPSLKSVTGIDKLEYRGEFTYGTHSTFTPISGDSFVKHIRCNVFRCRAKEVSDMTIEVVSYPNGLSPRIAFMNENGLTLKNVTIDAENLVFSTWSDLPVLKNVKGEAQYIKIYGTTLLDQKEVRDRFDKILVPDYAAEYQYNGSTQRKHLVLKNLIAAFNQHLKYSFLTPPFLLRDGVTIDDIVPGISKLNPKSLLIKDNRVSIYFTKTQVVTPTPYKVVMKNLTRGNSDMDYTMAFPTTSDGYRVVFSKNSNR